MIAALANVFMPKDEKAVLDALKNVLATKFGEAISSSSLSDDLIAQIKGEVPAAGMVAKVLELTRQASASSYWDTFVDVCLSTAAKSGYNPEAVVSLTSKLAKHLGATVPDYGSTSEKMATMLSSIASLGHDPDAAPTLGMVSICPNCDYAHLI